jgi:hypothetical protein
MNVEFCIKVNIHQNRIFGLQVDSGVVLGDEYLSPSGWRVMLKKD